MTYIFPHASDGKYVTFSSTADKSFCSNVSQILLFYFDVNKQIILGNRLRILEIIPMKMLLIYLMRQIVFWNASSCADNSNKENKLLLLTFRYTIMTDKI